MVKRILSIILLLVYTTASSGVVLNAHFCMGDYAGVSMVENDYSDECPNCGMKDSGCCHDVAQVLKIDNSGFTAPAALNFSTSFDLPTQIKLPAYQLCHADQTHAFIDKQVPSSSPPIYLLHCVFRI